MKLPTLAFSGMRSPLGQGSPRAEASPTGTIRPAANNAAVNCANPPSGGYCGANGLTGIAGFVGVAAQTGCFSEDVYDNCTPNHVSGLYVRYGPHQQGDSHWTVRAVRRGANGTNAVCHIPARQGNLDRTRPITCDGMVGGTFYSPDDDNGTYTQDNW